MHWQLVALIIIAYVSLILGLVTRSRFIRLYLCLPLSLLLFSHITLVQSIRQPTLLDRLWPCLIGLNGFIHAIELLLCPPDPHLAFFRLHEINTNIAAQSFSYRLKWALSLSCSQRGGGWNWRVPGIPPSPPYPTTSSFVLRSFLRWSANYLGLECLYIIFNYLSSPGTLRGPLVLLHGAMVYFTIHNPYELGCMAWVLLGFGGVEECPPLFGFWKDTGTLRGFWAKAWHQCFRQSITVIPNRALALFGMGPDTTGICAFFITGTFHALTLYAITAGKIYPCINTFLFFALQPLGFWIEHHVLGLRVENRTARPQNGTSAVAANGVGPKRTSPAFRTHPWLGYVWVAAWLSLTARLYFSEMVASGFYDLPGGWVAVPVLTRFVPLGRPL